MSVLFGNPSNLPLFGGFHRSLEGFMFNLEMDIELYPDFKLAFDAFYDKSLKNINILDLILDVAYIREILLSVQTIRLKRGNH